MTDKTIAVTILNQLGGNKFIAMTGAKDFFTNGNDCCFSIGKNPSGANRIKIVLDPDDTYTIQFMKFTSGWLDHKSLVYHEPKVQTIREVSGLYTENLIDTFVNTTKMYISL